MIFAGLKAAAAPYMLAIKAGIAVAIFLFGLGVGCSWQKSHDQGKIDKANARAASLKVQGDLLADQLRTIDAGTKAAKAAADAKVKAAEAEAKQAAADTVLAVKLATKAEADLEKAKRVPACRKLLETPSCVLLH